jgi:hypothetical protein
VIRSDACGRSFQSIVAAVSPLDPSCGLTFIVLASSPPAAMQASSMHMAAGPRAGLIGLFQRSNC